MKNKYIYFFFSGIVLSILFEILAPGKFISYSILFASFLMVFSLISKNKLFRKILIFLSIFELFFTFSMYLMAIFNPRISEIKNRIFRNHYPFLKKSEREIVIIPGNNKDKLFEFSLLTGRKLRKDYSEHDIDGGRIVPSRNNKYEVLVNTYGGSSTYGWKLSSSQTWQNQLQLEFIKNNNKKVGIRNLGIPGGTTSESIIYASFYDMGNKKYPKCSIHYHGWNDLRNNFITDLDNAYSKWHLLKMTHRGPIGSKYSSLLSFSNTLASIIWKYSQVPNRFIEEKKDVSQTLDPNLKEIIKNNIRTISVLSKKDNGRALFIPQIFNNDFQYSEGRYGWLPYVDDKNLPTLIKKINKLIETEAIKNDSFFSTNIDQKDFNNDDFVDIVHFSPKGAKKFAKLIYPEVLKCLNSSNSF